MSASTVLVLPFSWLYVFSSCVIWRVCLRLPNTCLLIERVCQRVQCLRQPPCPTCFLCSAASGQQLVPSILIHGQC